MTGWWFQPLWTILVNWDDYSQYMEKVSSCSKPPTRWNQASDFHKSCIFHGNGCPWIITWIPKLHGEAIIWTQRFSGHWMWTLSPCLIHGHGEFELNGHWISSWSWRSLSDHVEHIRNGFVWQWDTPFHHLPSTDHSSLSGSTFWHCHGEVTHPNFRTNSFSHHFFITLHYFTDHITAAGLLFGTLT